MTSSRDPDRIKAHHADSHANEHWGRIIDCSPSVIYIKDLRGRYTAINRQFENLSGFKQSEVIGKTDFDLFPRPVAENSTRNDQKVLDAGEPLEIEEFAPVQGVNHAFISIKYPLIDERGVIYGLCGVSTDITDRKKAENDLRRTTRSLNILKEYRKILHQTAEESLLIEEACRILVDTGGYSIAWAGFIRDDSVKSVFSAGHYGVRSDYLGHLRHTWEESVTGEGPAKKAIRTRKPQTARRITDDPNFEIWRETERHLNALIALPLCLDGVCIGALNIYSPDPDAFDSEEIDFLIQLADELAGGISYLREWKKHRIVEEDFAKIFSMSLDMICVADINTATFLKVNPAFTETLGFTESELLEKPFMDFIHPEDIGVTIEVVEKKLQAGARVINFENRYRCKDGSYKWLSWVSHPNPERGVTYAVARDITDAKHKDELLKKSKALLDAVGRMARVGGWELDTKTMEVSWTEETYRIHEVPMSYQPPLEDAINFFHPSDREKLSRSIQKALEAGEPYDMEVRFITAKGNELWTRTICQAEIENGQVVKLNGTFQDITDRKTIEEELSREKERLLVTLRSIGDGVITTDTNGRLVLINKVAEKLTGWTQSEARGRDIGEVFHIIDARTGEKCENPVEKALEAGTVIGLANHTNLISRDGSERMIADSGAPIFNTNSEIIGVVLVFRDVTEQYKIEKQLQQAQKMEAIGALAGGIAHDFNNILSVITGNISYALSKTDRHDDLHAVLTDVQGGAKQAQSLTQQLLTFAKGGEPVKQPLRLNPHLKEASEFVIRGARSKCRFNLANDLWTVDADPGQFHQVIGNLVINADQAMPDGGIIHIQTENMQIAADNGMRLPSGKYVKISIQDQGTGIQDKHIANIFDPYFTTKLTGSGLGLATAYSIVKRHGGHIAVYSEMGKGTVFHIYLLATSKAARESKNAGRFEHRGQGRVLIMDDQEPILRMAGRMLDKLGYETVTAADGSKAVESYRSAYDAGVPFDLVILDLTVPGGMGGADTMPELLKIDPKVKAVVSSGYSNDPIMANYQEYGFCGVVPKPYTKEQLAELLNRVLA